MKRALVAIAASAVLASACAAISGLDEDYRLASGSVLPGDAGPDSATSDGAALPPTDGAGPPDGATGCTTDCPVQCGAAPCSSCDDIKKNVAESVSGRYVVQGASAPVEVYCDMSIGTEGWTLLGRSVQNGSNPGTGPFDNASFGWHAATGSVTDDSKPYSLDVGKLAFVPTQMLFGSTASAKNWGGNAYRVTLPGTNFPTMHADNAVSIQPLAAVKGTCTTGGQMHRFAGYTNRTDVFFFRDNDQDDELFGLFPNGWFANIGTSCSFSGVLNTLQGMIFVR